MGVTSRLTMECKPTESSPPPEKHGEYALQLAHLITMAKHPGMKAYAWARAKELDASGGIFAGIADALKAAMTGQGKTSGSGQPITTKPR